MYGVRALLWLGETAGRRAALGAKYDTTTPPSTWQTASTEGSIAGGQQLYEQFATQRSRRAPVGR
jgi:hypothetical protein